MDQEKAEGRSPINEFLGRKTDDSISSDEILSAPPAASAANNLMVLVAGGPGAWTALLRSVGGIQNEFVTVKINLPSNWDQLVRKYKTFTPHYVKY